MTHIRTQIAIVGAGFAGSLMALVLRRIGWDCVLIERGTHPRFAIGESSTPSANLVLESVCRTYDLPRLLPISKYGRWQKAYPDIACGLKRGFSFFQHQPGKEFQPTPHHEHELLVGASPNDGIGDTHWYREEVDHFFVREAEHAGVPYLDRTEVNAVEHHEPGWCLSGRRGDDSIAIDASFIIDATGPAGFLARAVEIATDPVQLETNSWSIYSHFRGVELWENLLAEMGASTADYPYPCDAAALHHVLADGWMWVLRFNNGVTSAGIAFDGKRHPHSPDGDPEAEWQAALRQYPSLARQFSAAERIRPWVRTSRMQRQARRAVGPDWAMLPHAAYFFDPLFSAGNAHTLVGIQRLARLFESNRHRTSPGEHLPDFELLGNYERQLFREITFLDWLVHGCYCTFGRFDLLSDFTMYYFAGAVESETRFRGGAEQLGFLFSDFEPFRSAVKRSHDVLVRHDAVGGNSPEFAAKFFNQVAVDIGAFNPVGFCNWQKRNMYPFVGEC
ncbi:MAG TPA: FAD-dependent oxidoreductase [Pirellulales bacterium]|nr:FAD-dependent oxidoreductase [Pirellulales bacterium]